LGEVSIIQWIIALGAMGGILSFLIEFWYRILKPRVHGARIRMKVVHEILISRLKSIANELESYDSATIYIDDRRMKLLLSNNLRKKLHSLKLLLEDYTKHWHIARKIVRYILIDNVRRELLDIEREMIKNNKTIGGKSDLTSIFSSLDKEFMETSLMGKHIDLEQLANMQLSFVFEFKTIADEKRLRKYLKEVYWDLEREYALKILQKLRNEALDLCRHVISLLHIEARKLDSWYNFLYGWGREEIVKELEEEAKK